MHSFPSLARAEKKLLRLAGEVARRAGGVSHPRIIPQGKQNSHYGRRMANKRVVTTPQGKQNSHYGRRKENKRVVTTPQGKQNGHYGRRMANKRGVTTPKSEYHEMLVKTDKLFRFG